MLYDVTPSGGLNNYKLLLLGLHLAAAERGGKMVFPKQVLDFSPSPTGYGDVLLPFAEVFDTVALRRALPKSVTPRWWRRAQTLPFKDCFELGARAVRRGEGINVIAAFRPAPALAEQVTQVIEFLPPNTMGVQFRLERDWRGHVKRKGWSTGIVDGREIILDPTRLFEKMATNSDLRAYSTIFLCCDEDDLEFSKTSIKNAALQNGFEAVFKSEIPGLDRSSRFKMSVVDFEICRQLPAYIGLTASTFSNMLCAVESHNRSEPPNHFLHDFPSDETPRRLDRGRSTSPAGAVTQPPPSAGRN